MARAILRVAAVVWLLAAMGGFVVAVTGAAWLLDLLPPLTVDADAVRGAIVTMAAGAALVAAVHALVLIGLRGAHRWGSTIGILVSALLGVLLFALAVAAVTGVAAEASNALWLGPAAGCAVIATAGYAAVVIRLVQERRAASASLGGRR